MFRLPIVPKMRMLGLWRTPSMWLDNHLALKWLQVWHMDPISCFSRNTASLDWRGQRWDRRKACCWASEILQDESVGLSGCEHVLSFKKTEEWPLRQFRVQQCCHHHHRPRGHRLVDVCLGGVGGRHVTAVFWFYRVEWLPRAPGKDCLPDGPEDKRLEPKTVLL